MAKIASNLIAMASNSNLVAMAIAFVCSCQFWFFKLLYQACAGPAGQCREGFVTASRERHDLAQRKWLGTCRMMGDVPQQS